MSQILPSGRWLGVGAVVWATVLIALCGCSAFGSHGSGTLEQTTDLPPLADAAGHSAARPDLSGTWKLDKALSDNLREKLRTVMDHGRRSGEAREGDSGRRRRDRNHEGFEGLPPATGARIELPEVLRLQQKDKRLLLTGGDGAVQTIYTDNRGATVSANGGFRQRVITAGWEGQALVIETTLPSETRLVERYHLVGSPPQLWIDTLVRMPGREMGVILKRVYGRAAAMP